MVETLLQQGRGADWIWNTQDLGTAVSALAEFQRHQKAGAARGVRVVSGKQDVFDVASLGAASETDHRSRSAGRRRIGERQAAARHSAPAATAAGAAPVFYYLTATVVPRRAPVRPGDRGIQVERWYESYEGGKPITEVAEGELVRVRLRHHRAVGAALRDPGRRACRRVSRRWTSVFARSAESPARAPPIRRRSSRRR